MIVIAVLPRQILSLRIKGLRTPWRTKDVNRGVSFDTVPQPTAVRELTGVVRSPVYTIPVSSNDDKGPYVLTAVIVQACLHGCSRNRVAGEEVCIEVEVRVCHIRV